VCVGWLLVCLCVCVCVYMCVCVCVCVCVCCVLCFDCLCTVFFSSSPCFFDQVPCWFCFTGCCGSMLCCLTTTLASHLCCPFIVVLLLLGRAFDHCAHRGFTDIGEESATRSWAKSLTAQTGASACSQRHLQEARRRGHRARGEDQSVVPLRQQVLQIELLEPFLCTYLRVLVCWLLVSFMCVYVYAYVPPICM
jgi:uncharacterized membrane protein YdcZ (DUF606 family)